MRRFIRNSVSPSMAVGLFALVVALSGTSYAAVRLGHDSVGSPQIRDSSVQVADLSTAAKAAQPTLQSGQTMRGYFTGGAGDSTSGYFGQGITFPNKLPGSFIRNHVQYIEDGDPFTTRCPGPGRAQRGWACLYEGQSNGASLCCIYDQAYHSLAVSPYGFRIYWNVDASGNYADGQWVVRAP